VSGATGRNRAGRGFLSSARLSRPCENSCSPSSTIPGRTR
jgi:hypothetical protein